MWLQALLQIDRKKRPNYPHLWRHPFWTASLEPAQSPASSDASTHSLDMAAVMEQLMGPAVETPIMQPRPRPVIRQQAAAVNAPLPAALMTPGETQKPAEQPIKTRTRSQGTTSSPCNARACQTLLFYVQGLHQTLCFSPGF